MKKKLIFLLLFFITSFQLRAEMSIAYIDMDAIINKSTPGLLIIKEIESIKKKSESSLLKIEGELKKNEQKLINQKNILSENEYKTKFLELRSDIKKYNIKRANEEKLIRNNYIKMNSNLIKSVQPILIDYSKTNNISFLLQKKNIILGASKYDITNDIIKIVNKEIKKIK